MRSVLSLVLTFLLASPVHAQYSKAVIKTTIKRVEVAPAVTEVVKPAVYDGETLKTPAEIKEVTPAVYENQLDIPFHAYGQTVVMDGVNYYHLVPQGEENADKEVLVYVHYADEDAGKVKGFSGLIGDPATEQAKITSDPVYAKHYNVTKAEALATVSTHTVKPTDTADLLDGAKVGDVVTDKVLYDGADKDELAGFYAGMFDAKK